jgi:hypothetical protein
LLLPEPQHPNWKRKAESSNIDFEIMAERLENVMRKGNCLTLAVEMRQAIGAARRGVEAGDSGVHDLIPTLNKAERVARGMGCTK